jgi:MoaA/NifB/PqqE/SkfB family radical SAM enzyme/SAM-dependent methyltransferase
VDVSLRPGKGEPSLKPKCCSEERPVGKRPEDDPPARAQSRKEDISPKDLVRITGRGAPIYLYPETPFWFVPSPVADRLLRQWIKGASREELVRCWRKRSGGGYTAAALDVDQLFRSILPPPSTPYRGRKALSLESLCELWIHLTDECNLRCRHCLFETCQGSGRSLESGRIESLVEEACGLGSRLVCFTGGEPFVYPGFTELLRSLLAGHDDLRVAVLTNGTLIQGQMDALKCLDPDRLHFQVSLDGPESIHDRLRGRGTFRKTTDTLRGLVAASIPCSVAMAVNRENAPVMEELVGIADDLGVTTVHFIWHFVRGMGEEMERMSMKGLVDDLRHAVDRARSLGVHVDNLEAMRAQIFAPAGTRFDLGNAAWESLAVGPDGAVYPTPAMVDLEAFRAGSIGRGIEKVWRASPLLERIRSLSLTQVPKMKADPWRLILGGGDLDHCCVHKDGSKDVRRLRGDPYLPLYREMAGMLIAEEVRSLPVPEGPGLVLRMGDITTDCPSPKEVNFTHSNCLLSVGDGTTKGLVRRFYEDRAVTPDETILNPVSYDEQQIEYIPLEARVRLYGCGSPVTDADVNPGEVVVDLGCGTGVECFIAAREAGARGRAIGVDMSDAMLEIARRSRPAARDALGYDNTLFAKGYLEAIPLAEGVADLVVSNCVVNLNHHKRRVFQEIFRVLKPGGRLVISDVVAETEPPLAIRADHQLIGECIGGAMVQEGLFSMLRDLGFVNASIVKRFPYRTIQGHSFFSLTFRAWRPEQATRLNVSDAVYGGPFRAVVTEDGTVLHKGVRQSLSIGSRLDPASLGEAGVLLLDAASGSVTNLEAEQSCACFVPPNVEDIVASEDVPETGCLVCGAPLVYLTALEDKACARCGSVKPANALCEEGHFVCDACHVQDPKALIRTICTSTRETDMIRLLEEVRSDARFPMHGPEHHALVPAVILATYRNLGGEISENDISTGIDRGLSIPGGSCGFMGICGAAVGVGTAFSIILEASPLTPKPRRAVQMVLSEVIGALAAYDAARCCRRESILCLREAARLSEGLLPVRLRAEENSPCGQHHRNEECIRAGCPLFPRVSVPAQPSL